MTPNVEAITDVFRAVLEPTGLCVSAFAGAVGWACARWRGHADDHWRAATSLS